MKINYKTTILPTKTTWAVKKTLVSEIHGTNPILLKSAKGKEKNY